MTVKEFFIFAPGVRTGPWVYFIVDSGAHDNLSDVGSDVARG